MAELFDLAAAIPRGPELARARVHGSVDDVVAVLRSISDPSDLLTAVKAAAADLHWAVRLEPAAAETDDRLLRALYAESLVARGWSYRGVGPARNVPDEAWEPFRQCLARADRILTELCVDDGDDPLPWGLRVRVGMGLNLGLSEVRRRYDHAVAAGAHHSFALDISYLTAVEDSWLGTWEDARAFAAERRAAANPGGLEPVLDAVLDVERWTEASDDADKAWLRTPQQAAAWRELALESVFHPDHRPQTFTPFAHSVFAMLFSVGGHRAEAAAHFRALGPRPASDAGWRYMTAPEAAYQRHRAKAYGEPGPAGAGSLSRPVAAWAKRRKGAER